MLQDLEKHIHIHLYFLNAILISVLGSVDLAALAA